MSQKKEENSISKSRGTEKVSRESMPVTEGFILWLSGLVPEAFTEGKIDWEKLKLTLGEEVDERPERYNFTWAGKRNAIRILQMPSRATLVPIKEESVNWDTTKNLFIEGDNLEVLKLMLKPYFGRVKMIYIDPPYNTGNDFVYKDNYTDPLSTYLEMTGQKDGDGNIQTSNPETSGRFHSDWLSMMYPRLFLARQLLRDDGVIFVSIDDNEAHNLKILMNEVFGEENFITCVVWQKNFSPKNDATYFSSMHDYILVYARNAKLTKNDEIGWSRNLQPRSEEQDKRYKNPDNDPRGDWTSGGLDVKTYSKEYDYPITTPSGRTVKPPNGACWRFSKERLAELIADNRIWFGEDGNNVPRLKRFLSGVQQGIVPVTWWRREDYGDNQEATQQYKELMGEAEVNFDSPKPVRLIEGMLKLATNAIVQKGDIIMDFFAGSGTTAQAIMELNKNDDGNRYFILIQLPEPTSYVKFPTIADICKERLRRVIKKLSEENDGRLNLDTRETPLDLGFRVFKLTESNYKPWTGIDEKDPDIYTDNLEMFVDPLIDSWKSENVIYEVALKEGDGLNITITKVEGIIKNKILLISDPEKEQSFKICLDDKLDVETPKELKLRKDDLFICRDKALTDELAANLALQCKLKTI